ncbi:MAG: cell division protein FtsW, partial [Aliifodinibius sp.]|nr:cell division protein FtsW [Fodinibius sp.]
MLIGMTLSWVVFQINFDFLMKISTQLVVAGLLLLFVVLFVGKEVNG